MNRYAPLSPVQVVFDLISSDHQQLAPTAASYRVYADDGSEVQQGSLTVTGSESSLTVTVLAANNTIESGQINGARTVVLTVKTDAGAVELSETYLLELTSFLSVPTLSGMTVPESVMLAARMRSTVVENWMEVDDVDRRAALMEAWVRVSKFPFRPWRDHEQPPSEITDRNLIIGEFRINEIDNATWLLLPTHFRDALKRAQLIEAAVILGSDSVWDRRVDGLISKTVGESSEMFMSRRPGKLSISPKAFQELRPYVRQVIRIAR